MATTEDQSPGLGKASARRNLGPVAFVLVVLAVAMAIYALPAPSGVSARAIWRIARQPMPTVVLGPSTMYFVDPCDRDTRSVIQMLADGLGHAVTDASFGGQTLSDELNMAVFAGLQPATRDVILPIAHPFVDTATTPAFRAFEFYALINRGRVLARSDGWSDFWAGLAGRPDRLLGGYRFEGRAYGDYRALSATYFAREKRLAACPGVLTHDAVTTRSYFWWTQVASHDRTSLAQLIVQLDRFLVGRGVRLHVVILPSNQDQLALYSPDWARAVVSRQHAFAKVLAQQGVGVLDLAAGFHADAFAAQWCACIHLTAKGRAHLTDAMIADLRRPAGNAAPAQRAGAPVARSGEGT